MRCGEYEGELIVAGLGGMFDRARLILALDAKKPGKVLVVKARLHLKRHGHVTGTTQMIPRPLWDHLFESALAGNGKGPIGRRWVFAGRLAWLVRGDETLVRS